MLYFAVVAAVFALLVSCQNLLLSRRLEHWRELYLGLRGDYAKLHLRCVSGDIFDNNDRRCPRCGLTEKAAEANRFTGFTRGGTPPKDAA